MKTKSRNSVLELCRFIFSIVIVLYHGFFGFKGTSFPFNNANFVVDFFFLLTGFFLIRAFDKMPQEKPVKEGFQFIWARIKKMGIPLLICYIAQMFDNALEPPFKPLLHILWFVHYMLIVELVYYIIYALCKKKRKTFYIIIGVLSAICFIATYMVLIENNPFTFSLYHTDILRAPLFIGLGIFLSFIPKCKNILSQKKLTALVVIFMLLLFGIIILTGNDDITETIFELPVNFVLLPGIVYFGSQIEFSNPFANALGDCSLYLYIFQCPVYLIDKIHNNEWPMLPKSLHIIFFALIALGIKHIIAYKKRKALTV